MATHVKVLRKDTREQMFDRVFPDGISTQEALVKVKEYVQAEGLNTMYALVSLHSGEVQYEDFVLDHDVTWGLDIDGTLHVLYDNCLSYCDTRLGHQFRSRIRYTGEEVCSECLAKAAI